MCRRTLVESHVLLDVVQEGCAADAGNGYFGGTEYNLAEKAARLSRLVIVKHFQTDPVEYVADMTKRIVQSKSAEPKY